LNDGEESVRCRLIQMNVFLIRRITIEHLEVLEDVSDWDRFSREAVRSADVVVIQCQFFR